MVVGAVSISFISNKENTTTIKRELTIKNNKQTYSQLSFKSFSRNIHIYIQGAG